MINSQKYVPESDVPKLVARFVLLRSTRQQILPPDRDQSPQSPARKSVVNEYAIRSDSAAAYWSAMTNSSRALAGIANAVVSPSVAWIVNLSNN